VPSSTATAPTERVPAFGVKGLEKTYGSTPVLSGVDIEFKAGEVHALLGANGAGKSTLIKCLAGATPPSAGTISVDGKVWSDRGMSPRDALDAGVAVIYQHFSLIPTLPVADNIFLGSELRGPAANLHRREQFAIAGELLERLGVDVSPNELVSELPVAKQQLVEIAKAIHRNAKLLILDEPTASLSDAESRTLLEQVKRLREEGIAIVYVTHLLGEVFEIADRVTVLRDGRVSLARDVADVSPQDLIEAIAGGAQSAERADDLAPGEVVLAIDGLVGERFGPVSLQLRRGEIVGVFGLLGSGRTELLETLFGIRPHEAGTVRLDDREFDPGTPADAIARGLALVPAERLRQSMFDRLSTRDNLLLTRLRRLGRFGVRNLAAERAAYRELCEELSVKASGPGAPVWTLSGGNQQKVAVGRWLGKGLGVHVLMLDDPTQGIDVGSRGELYRVLHALAREHDLGVLFTSSSPEEVGIFADRALVLHEGRVAAELSRNEIRDDRLLALAHDSEL
jgi:ABC-type sugar transport system ATPase subunit